MFSLRRIHMQQLFRIQTRCKVDLPSSKSFWIMTRHHRKTADSQSARFHVNLLREGRTINTWPFPAALLAPISIPNRASAKMVLKYVLIALAALPGCLADDIAQLKSRQDAPASTACSKLKDKYPDITYSKLDLRYINANTGEGSRCYF